jgi:tRNA nucleotidyltransferase (CCA-adding enzyme)
MEFISDSSNSNKFKNHVRFYKVGGYLRDKQLGLHSNDIDYSVEAPSFSCMIDEIVTRGFTLIYEKEDYLTVRAKYGGKICDFVMCRKDGEYRDFRHPAKIIPGTIIDDLSRRDFTINAMAEDENGLLIDPHNGLCDIKNKIIRCVGSIERLREDALRILRALRFFITLPDFRLDEDIHCALNNKEIVTLLNHISEERIREELYKCFKHDSLLTIITLNKYPLLMEELFANKKIWLKPTLEK